MHAVKRNASPKQAVNMSFLFRGFDLTLAGVQGASAVYV